MSLGVVLISICAETCAHNMVLLTTPQLLLMFIGPVWYNLPSAGKSSDTHPQIIKQVRARWYFNFSCVRTKKICTT